ncbi:MAG: hypothetical protein M3680_33565 [Myxococcota bacterium]|nr:hypothetical protein [Myxococcota bacterium]
MADPVPYLDRKPGEPDNPDKVVSPKAYSRLKVAADGIAATKKVITGQGNQVPALQSSKMNAKYRLIAMRDPRAWEYTTQESADLANENQEADVAAKAEMAHGGNCGEHAWVAYHYLRLHAKGEPLQYSAKEGLDHAFVIVGDLKNDKDNELAVSDPWPNNPTACLWEDHFAHTADRKQINNYSNMVADGKSYKAAIMAGLKLSAYGEQLVKMSDTEEETQKETVDEREANHFWNHGDTAAPGHKFDYQQQGAGAGAGAQQGGQQRPGQQRE